MAFINIGGDPHDRSYRYKMPRLISKQEGRGNGAKTRIVNCADIAAALHRKPQVLTKFFGIDLGTQATWSDKEDACIVNGHREQKTLQDRLCQAFLPPFVLCPTCGLPETTMTTKKDDVEFDCMACGHHGMADPRHKLVKFIVADDKKDPDKKEKSKEKTKHKKPAEGDAGDKNDPNNKADKKKRKDKEKDEEKAKAKSKDKEKSKAKAKAKSRSKEEESDEEEWFTDISAEAVEARRVAEMVSMSSAAAAMITGQGARTTEQGGDAKPAAQEAPNLPAEEGGDTESSEEQEIDSGELLRSLLDAIGELKKSKDVSAVVNSWAEGLGGPGLAKGAMFSMLESLPEAVAKHATMILKALYDNDILTDDDIFAWHDGCDENKPVTAICQAFVEFLRED